MCDPIGWQASFAPNQELPDPFIVEGIKGMDCDSPKFYYGCTKDGSWLGDNRETRWEARRDALEKYHEMAVVVQEGQANE